MTQHTVCDVSSPLVMQVEPILDALVGQALQAGMVECVQRKVGRGTKAHPAVAASRQHGGVAAAFICDVPAAATATEATAPAETSLTATPATRPPPAAPPAAPAAAEAREAHVPVSGVTLGNEAEEVPLKQTVEAWAVQPGPQSLHEDAATIAQHSSAAAAAAAHPDQDSCSKYHSTPDPSTNDRAEDSISWAPDDSSTPMYFPTRAQDAWDASAPPMDGASAQSQPSRSSSSNGSSDGAPFKSQRPRKPFPDGCEDSWATNNASALAREERAAAALDVAEAAALGRCNRRFDNNGVRPGAEVIPSGGSGAGADDGIGVSDHETADSGSDSSIGSYGGGDGRGRDGSGGASGVETASGTTGSGRVVAACPSNMPTETIADEALAARQAAKSARLPNGSTRAEGQVEHSHEAKNDNAVVRDLQLYQPAGQTKAPETHKQAMRSSDSVVVENSCTSHPADLGASPTIQQKANLASSTEIARHSASLPETAQHDSSTAARAGPDDMLAADRDEPSIVPRTGTNSFLAVDLPQAAEARASQASDALPVMATTACAIHLAEAPNVDLAAAAAAAADLNSFDKTSEGVDPIEAVAEGAATSRAGAPGVNAYNKRGEGADGSGAISQEEHISDRAAEGVYGLMHWQGRQQTCHGRRLTCCACPASLQMRAPSAFDRSHQPQSIISRSLSMAPPKRVWQ